MQAPLFLYCRLLPAIMIQSPDAVLTDIANRCQEDHTSSSNMQQWQDMLGTAQAQAGSCAGHTAHLCQMAQTMHQKIQSGAYCLHVTSQQHQCWQTVWETSHVVHGKAPASGKSGHCAIAMKTLLYGCKWAESHRSVWRPQSPELHAVCRTVQVRHTASQVSSCSSQKV